MMEFIDQFIDTKKKRYHLFFLGMLICAIIIIIPYVVLGFRLSMINSYDSIFSIFDTKILQYTYISRVVFLLFHIYSYSWMEYLMAFLEAIHPMELLLFLFVIIGYPVLISKKITTKILMLESIQFIVLFICILLGIHSSSLMVACTYIRIIGIVLFLINSLILIYIIKYLNLRIKQYKNALNYMCIEKKHKKF